MHAPDMANNIVGLSIGACRFFLQPLLDELRVRHRYNRPVSLQEMALVHIANFERPVEHRHFHGSKLPQSCANLLRQEDILLLAWWIMRRSASIRSSSFRTSSEADNLWADKAGAEPCYLRLSK